MKDPLSRRIGTWAQSAGLRFVFAVLWFLPYRWRIPFGGWVTEHVIARLAGYETRACENLRETLPDLTENEMRGIARRVSNNAGRTLLETLSGKDFRVRAEGARVSGSGIAALESALVEGRGILMVSGHFGNYDVPRAALAARGVKAGALYRPFNNPFFENLFSEQVSKLAGPLFPRGRKGLTDMVRFLRAGGVVGILHDQALAQGETLSFLGRPAKTSLSAAELALRYDLLMLPVYGIRQPNGLDFELRIEAPIPHTDPETMMQAANDSLAAMVRAYPDQWFWIHRRWK